MFDEGLAQVERPRDIRACSDGGVAAGRVLTTDTARSVKKAALVRHAREQTGQ
jgi:hypothetical protein